MSLRKKVIIDFSAKKLEGKSYSQIERDYNIPQAGKKGDVARRWITWFKNKGYKINQFAPGEILDEEKFKKTLLAVGVKDLKNYSDKNVLIDSLSSVREKSINNLLLKKKWQVQTKTGTAWLESYENKINPEEIKKFREELIKDIPSVKSKFTPKVRTNYDTLAVISIPDFHIGREKNQDHNSIIFMGILEDLLIKSSHHYINNIVFVIGNDYFNSDFDYKTTKGTPQFDYQNWRETWVQGRNILIRAIEMLKNKKCPIHIINVPGNHDSNRMFMLGDYIEGYYKNDDQISVDNSDNLIKIHKYGDVLLAFEHGEFRQSEYESILASNYPREWGDTFYREFLCGHLHAETVKEFRGLKLRHLPSLAKESDWEKKQGYIHNKEAQMLVYSKNKLEAIYIS